jgi:hypothetical protein
MSELLLCVAVTTPLLLADNVVVPCSRCGTKLQRRPHATRGEPICLSCLQPDLPDKLEITPETAADIQTYLRGHTH